MGLACCMGILVVSAALPATSTSSNSLKQATLQTYGIEDGLPSPLITSLHQDSDGLLWIGTYGGLVRYDGLRFTRFTRRDNDEIRSHNISAMTEDPRGFLWVSTASGDLYRFRGNRVDWEEASASLPHPEIRTLAMDPCGDLWIGSFGGICRLRGEDLTCFDHEDGLPPDYEAGEMTSPSIEAAAFDASGRLWAATLAGLAFQEGERFELLRIGGVDRVATLRLGSDGRLWAGTNQGRIGTLDEFGFSVMLELGPEVQVSELAPTDDGGLWFGTFTHGAGRWDGERVQWLNQGDGLPTDNVQSLLVDRDGVTWVGTTRDLGRLTSTPIMQLGARQGIVGASVISIDEGHEALWVVTAEGGLNAFDGTAFLAIEPWSPGPSAGKPRFATEDDSGVVWLGSRPTGLHRWRPGERPQAVQYFADIRTRGLLQTRSGDLWVETWNHGIYRKTADGWKRHGQIDGLPSPGIFTSLESRDGGLWVGTRLGLARIVEDAVTSYGGSIGLADPAIVALYEDTSGALWLGTIAEGLVYYDGEHFTIIDESHGLQDNSVWAIVEDDAAHLWILSTAGISRVARSDLMAVIDGSRTTFESLEFGPSDGLVTPNGIGGFQSAGVKLRDGSLAFATSSGVALVLDPLRNIEAPPPPTPTVVSVLADGILLPTENGLIIPPGSRRVTFEVAAPTMVGVEHVTLRARLGGDSDEWDELGQAREISFTKLSPGQNIFELQSSRDGTTWSVPVRLAFLVSPLWYQTWWFRGALIIVFLFVGPLFYRFRIGQVRQREVHLAKLVADRTHELDLTNLRLEEMARTDALTGLANRRQFDDTLSSEWQRAIRSGDPLSLLFADVDHFKLYNDTLGHTAGDDCLRNLGHVFSDNVCRAGEIAARYGGEEFCVLLPRSPAETARLVAEKLRKAVLALSLAHPASSTAEVVTISVGIATAYPQKGEAPERLVVSADQSLYAAKLNGRNRVESRNLDERLNPT